MSKSKKNFTDKKDKDDKVLDKQTANSDEPVELVDIADPAESAEAVDLAESVTVDDLPQVTDVTLVEEPLLELEAAPEEPPAPAKESPAPPKGSRGPKKDDVYYDPPKQVDLVLSRVDPWSVLKLGFLISVAFAIVTVVVTVILWLVVDGMDVFGSIESFLKELGADSFLGMMDYLRLPKVVSYATVLSIINIVLFTAISTLLALLYNLLATLVGGVKVALMDE